MEPLISIALCTYNGSKFLSKQLESILNQSHQNIEIIIVDDFSTDDTPRLLENAAKNDSRIKLFYNEQNLGFNANFEKAITLCCGEFIAIADQDDIWELNKLERLLQNIGKNWLIFSNSRFIDKNGNNVDGQILANDFSMVGKNFRSLLFSNFVTGHTTLFSKDFKPYLLPIPEKGFYDWWMGFVATYHQKTTYLNQQLTLHRIHNASVTFRSDDDRKTDGRAERYGEIIDNLEITKNYKNLTNADRSIILKLLKAYKRLNFLDKLFLVLTFYRDYTVLFPDLKQRKGLSKFNYARRLVNKMF